MKHCRNAWIACLTGIVLAGCNGGGLTPNQKAQAVNQWNRSRASVLASLAADQLKDGSLDQCRATIITALGLEPANPALHLLAAKLSIEQDKLEDAQVHLLEARRLDPKNAEADYLNGVVLQRWQQLEKARESYAQAAAKDPAELSYLLADAEMLVALDRPGEALTLLQSKALFFEHSAVLRDEIGQLLVQQKQSPDGICELREASILSSDDPGIMEHLAFALYAEHRYAESLTCFLRLVKESGYEKRADLRAAMGECCGQAGQLIQARENFQQAVQLNPSCSAYWLSLAKAELQLKDLPSGEVAIRRAISLNASSSEAQCLLGYLRLQQKQLPESLAAFRAAADLDPNDSVSVGLEGFVLAKMGRPTEAARLYSRASELDPKGRLVAQLQGNQQ